MRSRAAAVRRRARRALTIADWLPGYTSRDLRGDLVAGLVLGVMLIPQGMAYAVLAGLPPVYGLYASLGPLLVYPLLGTSRRMAIGIAALDMLIVGAALARFAPATDAEAIALALALAALTGLMHLLMGLLRLGFLVDLLSRPVVIGFTTAAPIIIALSQLGNLLGVPWTRSQNLLVLLWSGAVALPDLHPLTTALGIGGSVLLIGLRRLHRAIPGALVLVVLATGAVWLWELPTLGVATVGPVPSGLPPIALPLVSPAALRDLLPAALTLALVQVMSVMSLGKSLAQQDGSRLHPNRELSAIGVCNLVGSVVGSPPISASFSRTAISISSGARTALANAFAAGVVALCLWLAGPLLALVPKPALAAIIMVAAFGMVDLALLRRLFQLRLTEGLIAMLTIVATLFVGIESGVLAGTAASMVVLLYRASRPHVAELGQLADGSFRDLSVMDDAAAIDGVLVVRIDGSINFSSAEFVRDDVLERVEGRERPVRAVILDGRGINDVDSTGLAALHGLVDDLQAQGISVRFAHMKAQLRDIVLRGGLARRLGAGDMACGPEDALRQIRAEEATARDFS